jgi:hypothetical protein
MKTLKKKSSNALKRKRILRNRMKRIIKNIKNSPKNTSQFLIKNHINCKELEEEDFIPFGSMIDVFDLQSENSTTDEEDEKQFIC